MSFPWRRALGVNSTASIVLPISYDPERAGAVRSAYGGNRGLPAEIDRRRGRRWRRTRARARARALRRRIVGRAVLPLLSGCNYRMIVRYLCVLIFFSLGRRRATPRRHDTRLQLALSRSPNDEAPPYYIYARLLLMLIARIVTLRIFHNIWSLVPVTKYQNALAPFLCAAPQHYVIIYVHYEF